MGLRSFAFDDEDLRYTLICGEEIDFDLKDFKELLRSKIKGDKNTFFISMESIKLFRERKKNLIYLVDSEDNLGVPSIFNWELTSHEFAGIIMLGIRKINCEFDPDDEMPVFRGLQINEFEELFTFKDLEDEYNGL